MNVQRIDNPLVQSVFDGYSDETREKLMRLRQVIFEVATETEGVGSLEETLKWGQISYLTHKPKSGTTIRIDEYGADRQQIAFFVHCQTSLVDKFRQMYPDSFGYEGNRAVILDDLDDEQVAVLKQLIELALTYHRRKR